MRQFFQRKTARGAFSSRNDRLRNFMVGVLTKPGLLPGELLQSALGCLSAASLQTGLTAGEARADTLDTVAAVQLCRRCRLRD
jgi:hypothetical protein